jgi:molybdate transport system substrate-binding protein
MRLLTLLLLAIVLALPAPARAQALAVAADSSLAEAVREVARAFESTRTGVTVTLDVAPAGLLLEKLASGSKFDVFISADLDTLQRGTDRRLLSPGPPRVLAGNAIVLVVAAAAAPGPQRLADLTRPEVQRIAMGRVASVPAGRHAREAIDVERLWPALQRKVIFADSVAQVLELVARGDVDAGFVYRTDATGVAGVHIAFTPESPANPVRHAAALVAASAHEALARDFLAALAAPAARQVFVRRGYAAN